MSDVERRHPNLVNLEEVEAVKQERGTAFGFSAKWLGRSTGAQGIGCTWYELEPGRAAFPAHFHCANEEAMFVLEGEGTLRIGEAEVTVGKGDYVTFLTGPDHAHKLTNTGKGPLRYLGMSTLLTTDVVGYPDSGKVAAMAVRMEPSGRPTVLVRAVFRQEAQVDYYDGEDTAG